MSEMYIVGTSKFSKAELQDVIKAIPSDKYVVLFYKSFDCTKCGHHVPVMLKGNKDTIEKDLDRMLLYVSQYANKWRKYKKEAAKGNAKCPICGGRLIPNENPKIE